MQRVFASYPRSGRVWTETRILLLLRLRDPSNANFNFLNKFLVNTHYGYQPESNATSSVEHSVSFKRRDLVTILFRDPCATINSHYYFAANRMEPRRPGFLAQGGSGKTKSSFVRGKLGVERLTNYLNDIDRYLVNKTNIHCLFYENMFDKEYVRREIPQIINQPPMTDEELEFVLKNSDIKNILADNLKKSELGAFLFNYLSGKSKQPQNQRKTRVGTIDSYKTEMDKADQGYILDYLRKHNRLEIFSKRYL